MRWMLLALLACGTPAPPSAEAPPVEVRTWLEGKPGPGGGVLVVQTAFDSEGEVRLPSPSIGGLQLEPLDAPQAERVGKREVVTQRYRFSGPRGSYEIPALEATWTADDGQALTASSSPLFVDLGVDPPRDALADIEEPGRVFTVPWGVVATVAGIGGLVGGGLWWALRGAVREVRPVPSVPPDLAALRRWEAVRADASLDDEAKATALSLLFREYIEAVLALPATRQTTTEILERLGSMKHLPEGNVPRARRLLRATDRVKYADARTTEELIEELDADLRAFVGTTRPQRWEEA